MLLGSVFVVAGSKFSLPTQSNYGAATRDMGSHQWVSIEAEILQELL
jgi:hypothetical protein